MGTVVILPHTIAQKFCEKKISKLRKFIAIKIAFPALTTQQSVSIFDNVFTLNRVKSLQFAKLEEK